MELVYALALTTAVLWGAGPMFAKRGMADGGSSLQGTLVVVVVDVVLYWAALFVRDGTGAIVNVTLASVVVFTAAGIVGTALGRLAEFAGVDRVGASVNSAVISTRPLFAGFLAVLLLGEPVTLVTLAGIVVLVGGLALIALSRGGDLTGWHLRDLLFPLGAAVAFGVGNVARKFGLDTFPELSILQAVALNELGALAVLAAYAGVAGRSDVLGAPRRTYAYFAGSGVLNAVALLSLFAALQLGRVVVVDPLVATAPLVAVLFAAVFLRDLERVTHRLLLGTVLVVVGVVLVVGDPSLLP